MNDFQAIADRVEIEALRGEFTDAAMMRDRARLASLFTQDGALRMPNIPAELAGREEIRTGGERLQDQWDFFVQTTHPGTIQLHGARAAGGRPLTPQPGTRLRRKELWADTPNFRDNTEGLAPYQVTNVPARRLPRPPVQCGRRCVEDTRHPKSATRRARPGPAARHGKPAREPLWITRGQRCE